jgi:glycosyltransferase involved in cell wall biosynthesis
VYTPRATRLAPPACAIRSVIPPSRYSGMQETTLGVAIITKNAAARLAECLQAVAFADQIVVIDGGSTDGTAEIAHAHGARVIEETDWPGFGPQKNRAVDALSTSWILSIDADEIVSPELAAAIRAALTAPTADVYAVDRHAAGQRGSFGKALGRGAWAFVRTYLLRRGFLDGRAGFMIAVFNAETVYYRFLKLARLGEKARR